MFIKKISTQQVPEKGNPCRMLFFDLSVRGHHPSYIKYLIQGWNQLKCQCDLMIVVSPRFLKEHSDVVALETTTFTGEVRFIAITEDEEAMLRSHKSRFKRLFRGFQEWKLLCNYVNKLEATECFLPYFDTFQLPLIFGPLCPCPISGIYFRPSFHYPLFESYRFRYADSLQHWRERFLIEKTLHRSSLHKLFCLDSFAVDWIQQNYPPSKIIALPDPIELQANSQIVVDDLSADLGIESHRQVFLLFGAITERKGIYPLLEAMNKLSSECCQQICLLLVGESKLKHELSTRIDSLRAEKPLQIIQHYEFVADDVIPAYFELADIVLALYQRHVGMSGILLHAAAMKTPVLGSDYGLMGEITRRYKLGITVDSSQSEAIAQGIVKCLTTPRCQLSDPDQMQRFVEKNTAEQFSSKIFQHLLSTSRVESIKPSVP